MLLIETFQVEFVFNNSKGWNFQKSLQIFNKFRSNKVRIEMFIGAIKMVKRGGSKRFKEEFIKISRKNLSKVENHHDCWKNSIVAIPFDNKLALCKRRSRRRRCWNKLPNLHVLSIPRRKVLNTWQRHACVNCSFSCELCNAQCTIELDWLQSHY